MPVLLSLHMSSGKSRWKSVSFLPFESVSPLFLKHKVISNFGHAGVGPCLNSFVSAFFMLYSLYL